MIRNDHFSKCRRRSYIGRICSVLVQTEQTPKLFCQLESISFPFIVPEVSLHAGLNFESGCLSPHGNWEGVHTGTYLNCLYSFRTAGWEATNLHQSSHTMELCKTSAEEGVVSCVKWADTDGPTQGTSSGPAVLFGVTLWIPHLFYSSTVTSCPCLYELSGSRQEHGNGKNPQ